MAHPCWFTRSGFAGRAEWSLDDETLVVAPEGAPPEAYPIREFAGIGGDDFTLELKIGGAGVCALSRLGADGQTLQDRIQQLWVTQRASVLRIAGLGDPHPFSGSTGPAGSSRPFRGLLFDDLLAFSPRGDDVEPLFLALAQTISFDEDRYVVAVKAWDAGAVEFGKLAGQTEEFLRAMRERRGAVASRASNVLATHLPTLALAPRTALAATWLPGRMLPVASLEQAATGARSALVTSWVAALPRKAEAGALQKWANNEKLFFGYSRPDALTAASPEASQAAQPADCQPNPPDDQTGAEEPPSEASSGEPPDALLWLLAGRGDIWLLEELTVGDHATYRFQSGPELPDLVSRLLCAPQFSREALYLPLEKLVSARSELAIAARDLPLLRSLRERFRERIIHSSPAAWRDAVERLS